MPGVDAPTAASSTSYSHYVESAVTGALTAVALVCLLWIPDYGYRYWFSWSARQCSKIWGLVLVISALYGAVSAYLATWGGLTIGGWNWLAGTISAAVAVLSLRTRRGVSAAARAASDSEENPIRQVQQVTHSVVERSLARLQGYMDSAALIGVRRWIRDLTPTEVRQVFASVQLDQLPANTDDYTEADRAKQRAALDALDESSDANIDDMRSKLRRMIVHLREGRKALEAYLPERDRRRRTTR